MPRRKLAQRVPFRIRQAIVAATPDRAWRMLSPVVHGETQWQRRLGSMQASSAVFRERSRVSDGVALRTGGRSYLARVVDRFRAEDALDGNLALVASALEAVGIDYSVIECRAGRRRAVLVRAADRRRVLGALRETDARKALYVGTVVNDRPRNVRPAAHGRFGRALTGAAVLRVFEVLAAPAGTLLAGPDYGCDVEFWEHHDGALVATRPHRTAVRVADRPGSESISLSGRQYPSHQEFKVPHSMDVRFPVDVVYTWVDGSDPDWLARKQQAWTQVQHGTVNELAANASRYLSRDELRYSLRSLEMFADWVRTVFIVTDGQVPQWLDVGHPKIRVVDHHDIFGAASDALPTFNSHAIESRLHHIDGLAEHYLYLNDDVFLARPLSPEMFFLGNGLSRFFLSRQHIPPGHASPDDAPVDSAGKNNRDLLRARFDRVVTHKFRHAPHPQRRSVLLEMETKFAEEFAATSRSRFRHPSDISIASSLHHHYAWLTGRAVPGDIRYYYADIGAPETSSRLRRILRERDYDTFCLNDHDTTLVEPREQARLIVDFLEAYFSVPSSYELRHD